MSRVPFLFCPAQKKQQRTVWWTEGVGFGISSIASSSLGDRKKGYPRRQALWEKVEACSRENHTEPHKHSETSRDQFAIMCVGFEHRKTRDLEGSSMAPQHARKVSLAPTPRCVRCLLSKWPLKECWLVFVYYRHHLFLGSILLRA